MVSTLPYNPSMLMVELKKKEELEGTLGILGHKNDVIFCYTCNRQACDHINEVKLKGNAELPAIVEFNAATGTQQKRYGKKIVSQKLV